MYKKLLLETNLSLNLENLNYTFAHLKCRFLFIFFKYFFLFLEASKINIYKVTKILGMSRSVIILIFRN